MMAEDRFFIRTLEDQEWGQVAALIHDSTNAWYTERGFPAIFNAGPSSTRLFCEVYESLDPGCCLVAEDRQTGRLAGSCFYHPRDTHVSLGIMNVHPDCFGLGVASALLRCVVEVAEQAQLPVRLVSSAMNLDSFSLYSRVGFRPVAVYQDMILSVPAGGMAERVAALPDVDRVRDATLADVPAMANLEQELLGISRGQDWEFFCRNEQNIWHVSVYEDPAGQLQGCLASVRHAASNMVGPGVARSVAVASGLLYRELDHQRDGQPVILVPAHYPELVQTVYHWGGRNCELHLAQVRGECPATRGVIFPTFMPETA